MNTRIRHFLAFLILLLTASLCQATPFHAALSGPAEATPNASPGTGMVTGNFDPVAHTLSINVTFSGLLAPTTAAHIHCCSVVPGAGTAGVATQTPTFSGFPLGAMAGNYNAVFDTSLPASWNGAFLTANGGGTAGAEQAFNAGLLAGQAYFNIHSMQFPSGEIRGFLQPVPEPANIALWGGGLLVLIGALRRRAGAART